LAPRDTGFSLRWEFVPFRAQDASIHWHWHAYTQTGALAARSAQAFETYTECVEDAQRHGYIPPR
jgi:hypothetical protein